MSVLQFVPTAPSWRVDYAALEARYDWLRPLRDTPQDPIHHAEGDVGLHTGMVLEALCAMPAYRALDDDGRAACFVACLLHDIAKPWTTRTEPSGSERGGRITAKGHSTKGAVFARRLLWEMGLPWRQREAICALIRFHQIPFFLVDKGEREAERGMLRIAESARADWLAVVAEADMRGRVCGDQQRVLDAIDLFRVCASDLGVVDSAYAFASDHARFCYFRDERRTRFDTAFDDTRCTVTLVSGLPASGKSSWIQQQLHNQGWEPQAVVSLDALREELDVDAKDAQRVVVDAAREQLKARLRQHKDAVWNATSLSRNLRGGVIDIAAAYGARVRVVAFEAAADVVAARNRERAETRVPAAAIERMLTRWEFPDRTEAHVVEVVDTG